MWVCYSWIYKPLWCIYTACCIPNFFLMKAERMMSFLAYAFCHWCSHTALSYVCFYVQTVPFYLRKFLPTSFSRNSSVRAGFAKCLETTFLRKQNRATAESVQARCYISEPLFQWQGLRVSGKVTYWLLSAKIFSGSTKANTPSVELDDRNMVRLRRLTPQRFATSTLVNQSTVWSAKIHFSTQT